MKASEALKVCEKALGSRVPVSEEWVVAVDALRREAEREEQERTKVTLAKQTDAVAAWRGCCGLPTSSCNCVEHLDCPTMKAAAATLRKLDEEGGKLLAELDRMIAAKRILECVTWKPTAALLRALGVEKKP